jgi:hypothetical protein
LTTEFFNREVEGRELKSFISYSLFNILKTPWAAQGIGGMRSSHAEGGAGAIAESRKARFPARSAGNAPKLRINYK